MNVVPNLFLFGIAVTLLGGSVICDREITYQFMPKVLGVTEVMSRRDRKPEDAHTETDQKKDPNPVISEDELKMMCAQGVELVRSKTKKMIEVSKDLPYGQRKKYVVESAREKVSFAVEVLPAYMCATEPAMYINVKVKNEETGAWEVLVIFKDRDPDRQTSLKDITVFTIQPAESINEAFSDEISIDMTLSDSEEPGIGITESLPRSLQLDESDYEDEDEESDSEYDTEEDDSEASLENSLIDMDDLQEYQRMEMCRRAVRVLTDMDLILHENKETGTSKYYSLTMKKEIIYEDDSRIMTDDVRTFALQAYKCPTEPEDIYLNVNQDDDDDDAREDDEPPMLWVFVKLNQWRPLFDILTYRLKFYDEIEQVSKEHLAHRRKTELTSSIRDFSVDLDELGANSRRQMCERAIRATLQTGVELMDGVEIEQSAFYDIKNKKYIITAQTITCPTNRSVSVYVHIGTDHKINKRISVVYVKDDEHHKKQLFPWVEDENVGKENVSVSTN